MEMKIYVVRDSQAECSMRPVFYERDAVAIRAFKMSVTNADDQMSSNPDDYTLYCIGEYNDETMIIMPLDPKRLINGLEAVSERKFDLEKIDALHKEIENIQNPQTEIDIQ